MKTSAFAFIALAMFGTALAAPSAPQELEVRGPKGINNRGSILCKKGSMADILKYVNQLPDFQLYKDGEHIICSGISHGIGGGTCAFFQGTGVTHFGAEVKELLTLLSQHENTNACGSIPVTYPASAGGINELSYAGMLTVNYVADTDNPCPPGVCGATNC
ncbi:hypothetical protein GGS26DRAFT_586813 [Hypomontagnella submonticulosa]|nr:hypothetical protein GGS26DRAFT_586813 [Hypomontagnella submonticulosa]